MTATALIPELAKLNRADKFRIMQFLLCDLAESENASLDEPVETIAPSEQDIDSLIDHIVTKNAELYRRLA